ncbi:PD-(D/E)XK nuclease family protein [Acaryochloris sp. IP29b_bin.148]|uniref:PD-(D/E)XK nuclease family protein n=1 Tax=Acaryochloris sp. IP29b_bin.148 TaxID=2969218 RepID=UPI002624772B|nr:PD-(D/E)XK nuclease family protein [Acaryochloris sp. IP29b_bin.148]
MQHRHQPIWQLSQGHLNLLASCLRKFQHRYLDRLDTSTPLDNHPHQQLGAQFHQLMQQQALGLEIGPLLATDTRLKAWFDAFVATPPPMIEGTRESEHQRLCWQDGYVLVAVYDLLIQNPDQAQILDWKTYALPKRADRLRHHWQTRLYLYLLAETSNYRPEQLSMTYWFAEASRQPEARANFLTFPYTSAWHKQTRQDLNRLLAQLNQGLVAYETGEAMQQVTFTEGKCVSPNHRCEFAERCERRLLEDEALALQDALVDIDAIAEIPLKTN